MRILLDTHTLLWFTAGAADLSAVARATIEDPSNESVVSVASVWEMAIKMSLGRLDLGSNLDGFVDNHIVANGIGLLRIRITHIAATVGLPFHHRDPFDRLIIAQALTEGLPVVGSDPEFSKYGVRMIW